MLASVSKGTMKQYKTAYNHWIMFCNKHNFNPFDVSILNVIDFLTLKFKEGLSYASLNSYRSAISLILGPHVGEDYRVKRFFRGVFQLKPNVPKYSETWNPEIVLKYLNTLYPNELLSLEILTKKCVTLLALVTAHRVQTLSLIKLDNIYKHETDIRIRIPDHIKTSGPGKNQPVLLLPYFNENVNICPARSLEVYIQKTEKLRRVAHKTLFITHKAPHGPASSQSISRWIKDMLRASGIDVNTFSAHSTRHAATSSAAKEGVNIETIRKMAGWTSGSNMFAKHYNRPLVQDASSFSRAICSSHLGL